MTNVTASALLEMEPLEGGLGETRFRARHNLDNLMHTAFGGQFLGQALAAAQRTVPGWPANSLSGIFLAAGAVDVPMEFSVAKLRDGRRFATRRVSAYQNERVVFEALCSFHDGEAGPAHQLEDFGDPPMPETLPSIAEMLAANAERLPALMMRIFDPAFPIELRFYGPETLLAPRAMRDFWFRMPSGGTVTMPADHQALLALMSDYWLPGVINAGHATGESRSLVSLNHAIWFHEPARVDDWLLYRTDSHWAAHGRGLARGLIFNRHGKLVATAVQEALSRAMR